MYIAPSCTTEIFSAEDALYYCTVSNNSGPGLVLALVCEVFWSDAIKARFA